MTGILRNLAVGTSAAAMAWSAPGLCGEEILYQPAPDWIAPVDLAAAQENSTTSLVLADQQLRIEEGRVWQYSDTAIRIASAQELTQAGTVGATWLPDKGDLIVHEVAILRDGTVIDTLAGGARLEILRREQELEQRMINGALTAVLAVPGLKVGDVLRTRYSITSADQMLGEEAESLQYLYREDEARPGFGRVLASWNKDLPVRVQAGPQAELPAPEIRDGYAWLDVSLPLAKADEMPLDAPIRYQRASLLQLGTFADWAEVSSIAAPFYDVTDAIEPGGDLAARVAGIAGEHTGQLERAIAALEVVQEDIGYLANGLDGGNYLPQSPQETWELRYGDCKAKTKLLLAMLAELGIGAEAVLVSTELGDALPEMLPVPGAFDHIVVRATIDGQQYWLDGTSAGANMALAGNVLPFGHGLPLRASGATLEPIAQILPRVAESVVTVDMDQRAGLEIPVLVTTRIELLGPAAAFINSSREQMTQDQQFELANGMLAPIMGAQQVTGIAFTPGDDDSQLGFEITSLMTSSASFEGDVGEVALGLPINRFAFAPDRSRRQWRDIPVAVGMPMKGSVTYRLHLPEGDFELAGPASLNQTVAGRQLERRATLDGPLLTVVETITSQGGEIAPASIAEERRSAAILSRDPLKLRATEGAARRWQYAGGADRAALEPVEAAYSAQIAREPDEITHYFNRAQFRSMTYDYAGAAEDLTAAIELDGSADAYTMRAQVFDELLQLENVRADLEEAYTLDPTPWRAMPLAHAMAEAGEIEEARALLEGETGDEEVRSALEQALAEFDALAGEKDAGLARLEGLLAEKPNDADLLNTKCWYLGSWQVSSDDALPVCTRAVESARNSAAALDSRALIHLRHGRLDEALSDANAALMQAPEQTASLLMRGLIRKARGEADGQGDIDQALARNPAIAPLYARYGFDLGS